LTSLDTIEPLTTPLPQKEYVNSNYHIIHFLTSLFKINIQQNRPVSSSRITLTSPDPSAIAVHKRSKRDTAQSETHEVTFIPHDDTVPYSGDDVESGQNEANKERKIVDEL
jgi:hypothetical protein